MNEEFAETAGRVGSLFLLHGFVAYAVTLWANRRSLQEWRESEGRHWTERARLLSPAMGTAHSNLLIVPSILLLLQVAVTPDWLTYLWLFGLAAVIGSLAGTYPFDHEVVPALESKRWIKVVLVSRVVLFFRWGMLFFAAYFMSPRFDLRCAVIGICILGWEVFMGLGGMQRLGVWLGLHTEADARVKQIVRNASEGLPVRIRNIFVAEDYSVEAWAFPNRNLMFSRRLIDALDDNGIEAITRHELSHLMEPRRVWAIRFLLHLWPLAHVFFRPLTAHFGVLGSIIPMAITIVAIRVRTAFVLSYEKSADAAAKRSEPEPLAYARALETMCRVAMFPVVYPGKRHTHPHPYDRFVAAGMTPDYPRPEAPASSTPIGRRIGSVFGAVVAIAVFRLVNRDSL